MGEFRLSRQSIRWRRAACKSGHNRISLLTRSSEAAPIQQQDRAAGRSRWEGSRSALGSRLSALGTDDKRWSVVSKEVTPHLRNFVLAFIVLGSVMALAQGMAGPLVKPAKPPQDILNNIEIEQKLNT